MLIARCAQLDVDVSTLRGAKIANEIGKKLRCQNGVLLVRKCTRHSVGTLVAIERPLAIGPSVNARRYELGKTTEKRRKKKAKHRGAECTCAAKFKISLRRP